MLPNIRAVLAAVAAAIVLLMISFGLVAAFRVAQESRTGSLQADLIQRGRAVVPASNEPRAISIEKPAPLEANPVQPVEIEEAPEISPIIVTAPQAEPPAVEPMPAEPAMTERTAEAIDTPLPERAAAAHVDPRVEPPMGGPLAEQPAVVHITPSAHGVVDHAAAKRKAKQEAARKARTARIARERRAAAKKARAAQARAKQQAVSPANNAPFGSFGNFGNSTFETVTSGGQRPAAQTPARSDR